MKEFKFKNVQEYEQDSNAIALYEYVKSQVEHIAEEGQVTIVDESFDHEFGTHECESVETSFDSIEFSIKFDDMTVNDHFDWIADLVRDQHIEISGFRVVADVDAETSGNNVTVVVNFDVE